MADQPGSGNGGEYATLAAIDSNRRKVLVQWLRDTGYQGYADDLEHSVTPAAMANEIADEVDADAGDNLHELLWHLRDWADQHEKLTP